MPQMMPINWMISFIFFILSFLIFISMNYYINVIYSNKNKNFKNNFKMNKLMNWKW
uniref:ATP synthase complex subunit 8 n=1 Tax=Ethmia eupostica TaxID=655039 RepID=A0A076EBI3_9NEOP|nr:ATP synthase F0 subunit 8 [Ethmia eupostica]